MNVFENILPIDGYAVMKRGSLPEDYIQSLTHLYQPLIGLTAIMLYQTLLNETVLQTDEKRQTHHTLMNYMNIPLDKIYGARRKLEGIGLLKTYKHKEEEHDYYTYILLEPFAPGDFFKDDMLAQLLYHHIGEDKFAMLKQGCQKLDDEPGDNDITAGFQEVFQTFRPQLTTTEQVPEEELNQGEQKDLTWIRQALEQRMIPVESVLTANNRKLISQMMVLYDLGEHEVEKAVMWALTDENRLDTNELKDACHDLFHSKHQESVIKLTDRITDSEPEQQPKQAPQTKEEQLIQELETISPKQLLEDLSRGNQASSQDLKLIRDTMTSQGLPTPVMNVLIHYVLLQSDMKLSKAYLQKIAGHWSRINLQTAQEAMEFAKQEKAKHQKSYPKKQQSRRAVSNEVVPDWFKERKKGKQEADLHTEYTETKEEKEEFDALLREFTDKK